MTLILKSTVGSRHTLQGGVVECDQCNARWECVTEGVCSYCEKRTLVDVDDNAQNSVCVDCPTYHGDGVNHCNVCDGPRTHVSDVDCALNDRDVCIDCGAHHGDPCPECGGKAYHRARCSHYDDNARSAVNGSR